MEYLVKRSEFFEAMFRGSMRETSEKVITLSEVLDMEDIFDDLLKYLYSGTIFRSIL